MQKGVYFHKTAGLTWHAGSARMRCGMQGHVAEPHESGKAQVAHRWRGHVAVATRVHADARGGAT